MDLQRFYMGEVFDAYEYFGAHREDDVFVFRTFAPNARGITVTGEFNSWQETPLEQYYQSGIWSCRIPEASYGQMYKYFVYGANGRQEHCDPYGFGMELRPGACSIIRDLKEYSFTDDEWMARRTRCYDEPLNIYELHLGSWRKQGKVFPRYDEIAGELIDYLKENAYNCVEFMPLSEHPFDGSWGYQNTGFFAPTSRYGTAAQLMELVDRLHRAGISAVMDFVPVHFAVDGYGLKTYDGTALYEYPHHDVGESEWGSLNFMHSDPRIASFLQSAANYWLKEYHFDGLRMDAVSRLIYWQGDERRGVNGSTLNFLKTMNRGLHELHPTAMLIAEDSTAFPGVTRPVEEGGLGFDYKWDLGWMHDTLDYLQAPPRERPAMPGKLTFSIHYFYNERYILPFSHDEVVHGKKTIIDKLYGSYEEKFAQAKLLYLYMATHPGKKLNFMGNELAMFREWDETREPDWDLLNYPAHDSFHRFMAELNRLYLSEVPLSANEMDRENFRWIDAGTGIPCVFSYERRFGGEILRAVLNFSDREIPLSPAEGAGVLIHTGWEKYGGTEKQEDAVPDRLPPFTGVLLRIA